MTTCAVFGEQGAALGCQGFVDRAQQIFRPGRRRESLQGFFDQVQVAHADTGGIAGVAHQRLAVLVEEVQRGADAQRFADVAGHRLFRRAVPLHPFERPHAPQLRIIDRGIGHAVVVGGNRITEAGVGDAPEGVCAPRAFFGRIEPAMGVVPGHLEERIQ
ncbi:hypothetical protein D3C72_1782740 [compost metagenome]